MATISVTVRADHLERLTKVPRPLIAIAELIWNGLDAEAHRVDMQLVYDLTNTLIKIVVSDDGIGMPHEVAREAFASLGGSWKRSAITSRSGGRLLHGRGGKGRFRAFSLGHHVTWSTVVKSAEGFETFDITGTVDHLGTFDISDAAATEATASGTTVTIADIPKNLPSLEKANVVQELGEEFAIYMRKYPGISIEYNGNAIDPASHELDSTAYDLEPATLANGNPTPVTLEVIEWRMPTDRHLFLCNADDFTLQVIPPGIQAPGFNFTAYLSSDYLRELDDNNLLDLDEMHEGLAGLLQQARETLRRHFKEQSARAAKELVAKWKSSKIYPYADEPKTQLEAAKREVFDVVALTLHDFAPEFDAGGEHAQRLSFQLVRQALEDGPAALRRILFEVFKLPEAKQSEFAELLDSTTLAAMITASKLVTDRLGFLRGLELMVFDPELNKMVRERKHLHRIIEKETWIFGEEFNLSASDKSLNEVLRKHLSRLGREFPEDDSPVLRADGREGIVDLMLSRTIPQPKADTHQHLVVELKRPTQDINSKVLQQVKDYAFAVADDARFVNTDTQWSFWALSGNMSQDVRREASQRNQPIGRVFDDGRIQIWVKTWSQVLDDANARMRFFADSLMFDASDEVILQQLRSRYEGLLPKEMVDKSGSKPLETDED